MGNLDLISKKVNINAIPHRFLNLLLRFGFLCLVVFCCTDVYASEYDHEAKTYNEKEKIKITGHIVDEEGIPLIGATVIVVGSPSMGTSADLEGNFSLEVPSSGILRFSYMGYTPIDVQIDPKQLFYSIVMKDNEKQLEEVVVVGYGVQRKESVVGAISQVKGEDLVQSGMSNITGAISGKLSGVATIQKSGQPGSDNSDIVIRGLSSFNNSSPLVLVDGVERDFASLDPNEVNSISVLKDASATAVFGAKGANGVIIVTTKRGTVDKPKMNVSASFGLQDPINVAKHIDSYTTMSMLNVAKMNDQQFSSLVPQAHLAEYARPLSRINSLRYPDVNWFGELTEPFVPTYDINFNVSGGTKFVRYFTSVGYMHQGSLFKGINSGGLDSRFYYDRINYRANLDFSITKSSLLSFNFGGSVGIQNKPNEGGVKGALWRDIFGSSTAKYPMYYPGWAMEDVPDPDYPGLAEDRLISSAGDFTGNPYYTLINGKFIQNTGSKLFTDIVFDQKLDFVTKGLSFKGKVAMSSYYEYNTLSTAYSAASYFLDFSLIGSNSNPWSRTGGSDEVYTPNPPYVTVGGLNDNYYYDLYYDMSFNYNRSFNDHNVTGLVLMNFQEMGKKTDFPYYNTALVGRATYDYARKYLVEVNMGYTGSERFAPGNRFGFFPSAAVGWIVSEEKFFKEALPWVNKLKIRYSDGLVGSDYANNRWLYISQFSKDNNGYIKEDPIANLVAQWEEAHKRDLGVEFGFFDELSVNIDFFDEKRTKMLIPVGNSVPMWVGNSFKELNKGEIKKHGFEVEVDYNKRIAPDFSFNLKGNFGFNENRILYQDDAPYALSHKRQTGTAIGSQTNGAYLADNGYFTSVDDIHSSISPLLDAGGLVVGDLKFIDYYVDGTINKDDLTRMKGSTQPPISYAFGGGFNWKGFDFSFLFQGYAGKYVNFDQMYEYEFYKGNYKIHQSSIDYWSPANTNGNHGALHYTDGWFPILSWSGVGEGETNAGYGAKMLGKSWRKSDFLRLKDVYIGYSLKSKKLKDTMGIQVVKFYVTGNNLLTFTSLLEGDPENTYLRYGDYPQMRTVKFGLQVAF